MKKWILLFGLLAFCFSCSAESGSIYDSFQVVHNDLYLDIRDFKDNTIQGTATITIKSKQNKLTSASFLLKSFHIDSVLVNGKPVTTYQYNDSLVSIPLSSPLNKDEEAVLRIVYNGQPVGSDFGGLVFNNDLQMAHNMGSSLNDIPHSYGRGWFPAVDNYRSRSTFDLHLRVDNHLKGIGSGILIDTIPNKDGSTTWHWRVNQPIPDYLVSLAVGNYEKIHYDYHQQDRILPIDIYVLPNELEKANKAYKDLPDIVAVFEDYFGEYAFDRIGFVSVNSPGGAMEHVGNIAMPKLELMHLPIYRELIIHEFAHSWFGNQVTCASEGDMWLNEGFATFCPMLINEKLFPDVIIPDYRRQLQLVAWMAPRYEEGFKALKGMPEAFTFSPSNYYKGAMVIHTLRGLLGDDKFFPAVREHLKKYKFNHISTDEFAAFMSEHTGTDLTDFFDLMVNNPGFVAFEIDSIRGSLAEDEAYKGRVYLEQKLSGAPEYGKNIRVPVTFFDESGEWGEKRYLTVSGQFSDHPIELPFEPAFGIVDYDIEVCKASLCDKLFIDTVASFSRLFNSITITAKELPSPFNIYLENYLATPDATDPASGITVMENCYWRISGNIPPSTILNGKFSPAAGNPESSSVLSSDKALFMMYRENASSEWEKLLELTTQTRRSQTIEVENLKTGEYCIGIKD